MAQPANLLDSLKTARRSSSMLSNLGDIEVLEPTYHNLNVLTPKRSLWM